MALAHCFAFGAVEGDDFEFIAFEGLVDEVFGGEAHAAGLFAELEGDSGLAVPAAVDEGGAGEAVGLAKVEGEVVKLANVGEGAFCCAFSHRRA